MIDGKENLRARRHQIYVKGWVRPLRVSRSLNVEATWIDFWGPHMDPRLRAFVIASVQWRPDWEWTITSLKRNPASDKSGHNWEIIEAIDFRSKTWTLEQLVAYKNWTWFWWHCDPKLIDIVIEDERYDPKYKGKPPHTHCEVDRPYWKRSA